MEHHVTRPIDPRASRVDFMVRHLGVGRLVGQIGRFEGTVTTDGAQVLRGFELLLDPDSVHTGDPGWDARVREGRIFGGTEHAVVQFRGTWTRPIAHDRYRVDALLTMHGETHYVELVAGHGELEADEAGRRLYVARAQGMIDRREWRGAVHPILEAGGLLLGHEVHVRLTLGAPADDRVAP